jgi:hypothetical protein
MKAIFYFVILQKKKTFKFNKNKLIIFQVLSTRTHTVKDRKSNVANKYNEFKKSIGTNILGNILVKRTKKSGRYFMAHIKVC